MATQNELALQMLAQLRVLDPSVSAEVGTPERKILDTVAQALSESQIDINILSGALDLDAKFGADLDKFLGLFGFGRQQGTRATGFVTFSRITASNYDTPIPLNTQVLAPSVDNNGLTTSVTFVTTESVTLPAGSTEVIAPVQATILGTLGNVAANVITEFSGTPILGITTVDNIIPTTGGVDAETDEELKIRFKNTVFRNLSGTQDQFLALAISTQFTTKANVVGPISRYREYLQVPNVDDATLDVLNSNLGGNGQAGQWTTALSTIPYSKYIYSTIPYFVSNDLSGLELVFYRQDTDFLMNVGPLRDQGDTYRERIEGIGLNPNSDAAATYQPNLTLYNVYTGLDETVQALRPKDIALFEHSYMSSASRNDFTRNITNCVDVFVNGQNPTTASTTIAKPSGGANLFTGVPTDRFYFDNFRRLGQPNHRPIQGNIFTGLFWEPVIDLPDEIVVNDTTYFKGEHYWVIQDVSSIGGTVRTRNGIEWSTGVPGISAGDVAGAPLSGPTIAANTATAVTVDKYTYDKNIIDLQTALEANKQITTDVLAHQATTRYFKLDITVMYTQGTTQSDANQSIVDALDLYFGGQYFGTTIQLSDILQAVHNAGGVDNVRWSKEILSAQGLTADSTGNPRDRVVECDIDGFPLLNVILDRKTAGNVSTHEVWTMYNTGAPTGGSFQISQGTNVATILYNDTAGSIRSKLAAVSIAVNAITGSGTAVDPYILTFSGLGWQTEPLVASTAALTGGTAIYNADYFLKDNELPSLAPSALSTDTLSGLIIRPRAQNTWNQL